MLVIIDADVVTRKSSVAIGICKKSYKITIFVLKHQQNSKINEPVSKFFFTIFLFVAMRKNFSIEMKTDKKCSYKHFTLKATLKPLKQQTTILFREIKLWKHGMSTLLNQQIVKIVELCCEWLKGGYPIIFASNVFHNSHLIQKCIQNQQQLQMRVVKNIQRKDDRMNSL